MDPEILRTRNWTAIRELLDSMNVVDLADVLEQMEGPDAVRVFRMLPKDTAAEVFSYLSHDTQQVIVEAITDREVGGIIDELFLDDAVDFIEEMPANVVKRVLAAVPPEKRDMINHFLNYPEDSAGSIMTVEYVDLKRYFSVAEAFSYIRKHGVDKETIYTCYVIDASRKLLGTVSVRTLLLAREEELVGDIMDQNIISAKTTEDREALTNDFRKYGLLAMPVVDNEDRLVGIVTVDDALTVQEEEATEDFSIMAAISPSEEPYLKTSVFRLARNRVLWLSLLMLSATVTSAIINGFQDALAVMPGLIAFIPMLMGTGGNAGSQSSTLVIRGLALEEVSPADASRVLWKEIRVACLCGGVLVVINFVRMALMGYSLIVSLTVCLALLSAVVMAKSVGCLLPLGAKRLGLDPAVMASPGISTLVDAGTLLLYFGLAKALLGI